MVDSFGVLVVGPPTCCSGWLNPSGGTGVGSIPAMLSCDVVLSLPSLVTGAKCFSLEESSSFASSPLSDRLPAWPYLHFCAFGICTLSLSEDETVSIEGGSTVC